MPLSHFFANPSLLANHLRKRPKSDSGGLLIGAFDLFHAGHQPLLEAAKTQCDFLVIGLLPDTSLHHKDGKYRPPYPLIERAEMLLGTRYVNAVVDFSCGLEALLHHYKPDKILKARLSQANSAPVQPLFENNETIPLQLLEGVIDEKDATEIAIARISKKLQISIPGAPLSQIQLKTQPALAKKKLPIIALKRLSSFIQQWHTQGEFLITTNGSFDLLHPGHLLYLQQAKALGGTFLVLVNDDPSIRNAKGSQRPIFHQQERMEALATLACVDYVIPFAGDNPLYLLDQIKPNIHVKGGSFEEARIAQEKQLIESYGGRFQCFDLIGGFSSTNLLETFIDLYKI